MYVLHNENKHKGDFVESRYLGTQFRGENKPPGHFNKFTPKECHHLDNFRANVNDIHDRYAKSLCLAANAAVIMRLPFGNADQSTDIMAHRLKQSQMYGEGTERHDRRIGIYYDNEYNLLFDKWFLKYLADFEKIVQKIQPCLSFRQDIMELLQRNKSNADVDCVYFDPPYGGSASDYAAVYRFLEEYIICKSISQEGYIEMNGDRFVKKDHYEDNFREMLEAADNIPTWIFSYNDNSWKNVKHIVNIIGEYRNYVRLEVLSSDYKYLYRKKENERTGQEYLIIAR